MVICDRAVLFETPNMRDALMSKTISATRPSMSSSDRAARRYPTVLRVTDRI